MLAAQGIAVEQNDRLVRGLDYYNDTVFEWVSNDLGAQGTVCGGGRYDGLVEQLGGKSVPAIGFAMGIERLFLLLEAQAFAALPGNDKPDAYFIVAGKELQPYAFALAENLRNARPDFAIMHNLSPGSLKSQFKKADKSGARYAFVIAEDEVANNRVTVKDLQTGEQLQYALQDDLQELLAGL